MDQSLGKNIYRLRYSIRLLSDISFPVRPSEGLPDWIFGADIRKAAQERVKGEDECRKALSRLRFSFAYIEKDGIRSVPSPVSFAYVRGNTAQLRDRQARPEADTAYERVHYLPRCYVADPDSEIVRTASVRQTAAGDRRTLRADQSFQGFIEGGREALERLAGALDGDMRMAGGEIRMCPLTIIGTPPDEERAADITVRVISPVLFRNAAGLYDESPEPIRRALSEMLGAPEELVPAGRYRETAKIHIPGLPAAYGTAGGSSFRFRCAQAVGISRIGSCFIGCGTADGYGEIAAGRSKDLYRRKLCKEGEGDA